MRERFTHEYPGKGNTGNENAGKSAVTGMTAVGGTSRREMLKSVGRYGVLLGLLGGVGALAGRRACTQTVCAGCPLEARCDLDQAREARARGAENGGRS